MREQRPRPGRKPSRWWFSIFQMRTRDLGSSAQGDTLELGKGRLLDCPVLTLQSLHFSLIPSLGSWHCPCAQGPRAPVVLGSELLSFPTDYSTMQAVQASMILSTILCCIAFLIFLLQLFRLKQGERFVLTSIIQLMACK